MLKCGTKTGIFCLSMGHFVADYYNTFLPVLLPFVMVKLDMSLSMCGMLVMVLAFMASTIQPFVGYLTDRHNSSHLLLAVIPLCGLFICFAGYAPNKVALFILCALLGLTIAFIHPVGSALLSKVGDIKNMGRYMSFYMVGGNSGCAVAPIVVMWFLDRYDITYLPILALPAVLLGVVFYWTGLYKLPSANAKPMANAEDVSFVEIFKNRSVVMLNAAMGLRCCTHVAMSTFLPMIMLEHGVSNMVSGTYLSIFLLGSALGGFAGGELGDRFGHKRLMIAVLFLDIFPLLFFLCNPTAGLASMLALLLGGFFLQAPQPSSIVWTCRLMPKYIGVASGMMMGLCFGLGSMGAALTAVLGDYVGLETALLVSVIPVGISVLLTMLTPYTKEPQHDMI